MRYEVGGLRRVMLARGASFYDLAADLAVPALAGALLFATATRIHPRMTE